MFSRIDKKFINYQFLSKCEKLIDACAKRGVLYYAISGFRSPEEQAKLYAIGRTTELSRKPVTNAKPFTSMHNYGLAIDFCADKDASREGLQPDWNIESYAILAEEATKLGLEAAYYWKSFKEGPHVQLKVNKSLQELQAAYAQGGLPAVWKLV